jgi:hypothetical protein
VTYQDADGDTVTFTKPFLTDANAINVFTFDTGTVDGSNATKQQLRSLNLTGEPAARYWTPSAGPTTTASWPRWSGR